MATHSSILAWRIPWTEELAGYSPWGHKESDTTKRLTIPISGTLKPRFRTSLVVYKKLIKINKTQYIKT